MRARLYSICAVSVVTTCRVTVTGLVDNGDGRGIEHLERGPAFVEVDAPGDADGLTVEIVSVAGLDEHGDAGGIRVPLTELDQRGAAWSWPAGDDRALHRPDLASAGSGFRPPDRIGTAGRGCSGRRGRRRGGRLHSEDGLHFSDRRASDVGGLGGGCIRRARGRRAA